MLALLALAACLDLEPVGAVDAVDRTGDTEVVVLAPADLADAWRPFVEWKTARGLPTELVLLEDIDEEGVDAPARIKARIAREAARGVHTFILGADSPLLPHRTVNTWLIEDVEGNDSPQDVASDQYYADLDDWDSDGDGHWATPADGMDLLPDVVVARVPARSAEQVEAFTAKVMAFERWPVPDYQDRALLLGEWAADFNGVEVYSSSALENLVLPLFPGDFDVTRLYEEHADYPGALPNDAEHQLAAFTAGQSLALNFGHGDARRIGNLGLTDLWALENVDRPMILATTECKGCSFTLESPVHVACEAFVLAEGGGVAYLGSTHWGAGFPSLIAFYLEFFADLYGDGQPGLTLGERVKRTQAAYTDAEALSEEGHPDRWTALTMVLMGDPTVVPWQGTPRSIEVEQLHDGGTRCFTAAGVEGATMALLAEDGTLQVGTTDGQGRVCFADPGVSWRLTVTGAGVLPVEIEG